MKITGLPGALFCWN